MVVCVFRDNVGHHVRVFCRTSILPSFPSGGGKGGGGDWVVCVAGWRKIMRSDCGVAREPHAHVTLEMGARGDTSPSRE